eukprot:364429-Chlamydomonas_euryale.AAC.10
MGSEWAVNDQDMGRAWARHAQGMGWAWAGHEHRHGHGHVQGMGWACAGHGLGMCRACKGGGTACNLMHGMHSILRGMSILMHASTLTAWSTFA